MAGGNFTANFRVSISGNIYKFLPLELGRTERYIEKPLRSGLADGQRVRVTVENNKGVKWEPLPDDQPSARPAVGGGDRPEPTPTPRTSVEGAPRAPAETPARSHGGTPANGNHGTPARTTLIARRRGRPGISPTRTTSSRSPRQCVPVDCRRVASRHSTSGATTGTAHGWR